MQSLSCDDHLHVSSNEIIQILSQDAKGNVVVM